MATVTPKFKLKTPKADSPTLIVLKVYFKKERYICSTGEKVDPKYWDGGLGRVKIEGCPKEQKQKFKDINFVLNHYENGAIKIFDHFIIQGTTPTSEEIKSMLDKAFGKITNQPVNKIPDFFSFTETFIEQSRITKAPSVIKGYNDTLSKLRSFQKEIHYPVDFPTINLKFYYKFVEYLDSRSIGVNTIGHKHIKNLKAFVHAAQRRGHAINPEIDNPEFKKLSEETDKIYLSEEEVNRIYNLDLSKNPRLDKVRDLFLIGCNTALRFSDYSLIKKEAIREIQGKPYLNTRMDKGDRRVVVPLNSMALNILEKYNYSLPRAISNQKMNKYLKELGKLAKLDDQMSVTTYVGLKRVDKTIKKYEFLTTHTARRTGATNMYLAKIPVLSIMKLTGHKTVNVFMKYIRISDLEHAMDIASNPFFE